MPRYTPEEKNKRSLEFEVKIIETIVRLTTDSYHMTHYVPSTEILEIKTLAEKRLKRIEIYKSGNKKNNQKDNRVIFEVSNK